MKLDDESISSLLSQDVVVFENVRDFVVETIGNELMKKVRSEDLSMKKYDIENKMRLSNIVPTNIKQPVITIARSLITEKEIINEALTKARIEEARASVEPTRIFKDKLSSAKAKLLTMKSIVSWRLLDF